MKIKIMTLMLLLAAFALSTVAHHAFAMFDLTKETAYKGTVEQYHWENPHSNLILRVEPGAKDPTTVGTWFIEGQSIAIMSRQGWTRSTLKPGDKVIAIAHPMKNGAKGASLFFIVEPDGSRLYGDIARPNEDQEKIIKETISSLKD